MNNQETPAPETIAALLDSRRIEGEAVITGTLAHIDQRTNKAQNQYAVVTVDDGTGSLAVQFFPKTWRLVRQHLVQGTRFTISGRINHYDGVTTLFGSTAATAQ